MDISTQNIKELSNGTTTTLAEYRQLVEQFKSKITVNLRDMASVDPHYSLAIGLAEWQNVKRGAAGYEATRRAALALSKLISKK